MNIHFFKTNDKFTRPMFFRLLWPALASSFGWALSDMADAIVVGQSLGSTGLAAISLILPIYMFNCMMAHGFGLGGSIRFSYYLSNGHHKKANTFFNGVLAVSLVCSIITCILATVLMNPILGILGTTPTNQALYEATKDYYQVLVLSTPLFYLSNILNYFLRNDSSQNRAGLGSVIGNVSDILLNILLVLFFGLGTRGAALSTAIGQVIAITIYLPAFFKKTSNVVIQFNFDFSVFGEVIQSLLQGLATSIHYLYQLIFFLLCNNLLMKLLGHNGVAIFDLIQNTSYLILYLYEGTCRAMQPILSVYCGEHNLLGKKYLTKLGFGIGIFIGTILILIIAIFPELFCSLFGIYQIDLQSLASRALRIYCIGAFFAGINILLCNYYQSCEMIRPVILLETMRGLVLLIPSVMYFANFGIYDFWYLFPATEAGSFCIFLILHHVLKFHMNQNDDVAVFQYTLSSKNQNIEELLKSVIQFCEKFDADIKQQYFVSLTVEELTLAILKNGIKDCDDGYIQYTLIAQNNHHFKLYLRDNARFFNPFELDMATIDEGEKYIDSVGILVLKNKTREFHYQRYQGFNTLVLVI